MKRLMDKCGLSVILTSLTDMQSLCVEKIEAEDDLQLSMRVGGIYPLHKGASNRPLLAYMEQEKADGYIEALDRKRRRRKGLSGKWRRLGEGDTIIPRDFCHRDYFPSAFPSSV